MGAEAPGPRLIAIMVPRSLALVDRAGLRIGGPSRGAAEEAERFCASGRPVDERLEEVPGVR